MFGWKWKSGEMKKVSLYKFIHILLLKNDSQLKQINDKQPKKKQSLNSLKNKNHVQKKSCLVKQREKKKGRKKKKELKVEGNGQPRMGKEKKKKMEATSQDSTKKRKKKKKLAVQGHFCLKPHFLLSIFSLI